MYSVVKTAQLKIHLNNTILYTFYYIIKSLHSYYNKSKYSKRAYSMKIGARLKKYRLAKGYTIYKLSKETDISQNHISAIENDKRQPTIDTLERLVAPMGISLAELFNINESVSFLTENERRLVENYRSMPDESAELLLGLSDVLSK